MGPDRLVVGECRGAEVVHLLTAMNTGHPVPERLCTPIARRRSLRLWALGALAGLDSRTVALHTATALNALSTWNTGTDAAASKVFTACTPQPQGSEEYLQVRRISTGLKLGTSPRNGEAENMKGGSNEAERKRATGSLSRTLD